MQLERYDVIISSALQPANRSCHKSMETTTNIKTSSQIQYPKHTDTKNHIQSDSKTSYTILDFIMPRGNGHQSKVHYHGKEEDFVVYVDDIKSVQDWKNDRSIPLAQVVSGFKIFITHKYDYSSSPDLRFCYSVDRALADSLSNRF